MLPLLSCPLCPWWEKNGSSASNVAAAPTLLAKMAAELAALALAANGSILHSPLTA